MIRVVIADDSAFMRKVLKDLFTKQPDFEVAATAANGKDAIDKVVELQPDLVTMDVNMPVMDGLNALAVIMEKRPTPVVMLSSLTQQGTEATVRALSLGAVDFVSKAGGSISKLDAIEDELLEKCRNAVKARVRKITYVPQKKITMETTAASKPAPPVMKRVELPVRQGLKLGGTATPPTPQKEQPAGFGIRRNNPLLQVRGRPQPPAPNKVTPVVMGSTGNGANKLVAIGTSTGGPQALQQVITRLPADLPCGVVVVQHMPAGFTKALADRLDTISQVSVKEAEDGDVIQPGHVYIAPGSHHLKVRDDGGSRKITLNQDPPVGNHRPAVNVMYDSVAPIGKNLVAVIMTGMGCDGCEGMKKIKASGGYSIAQDEPTCVVYGMPKAVVEAGLADEVKPIESIAQAIVEAVKR
ncbi:MAG: chemotaxis response regulator protein-glutamate methylesterase [Selenomonas sp.]|jgi:two-component system chemotaxis response regulator CheB|nr:chemotaxis response regulator protein-glutamate methylesterase [Selenomonas sp.]MBQ1460750.1 chemotaxis response regulator protein-glutamate methylesterase [Selenomonas sp.]MBQ1615037.1 chemotaxis response regulator protein-glutamate methylesterase [Selenomonas sp.]MBQ2137414.1 chemotaxis response regulator protein-glutamate methylesterase [Selenomonas sp.]